MRILAIHAHPDDIEFLCAGTLYLLRDHGHDIHLCNVCNGDKGSAKHTSEEIAAIRLQEAKNAAALLQAEHTCLGIPDLSVYDDENTRLLVTGFLRECKPDIIFTASPQDYMLDHEIVSRLVRHAAFGAGAGLYNTGSAEPLGHIPTLYYMDPIEGKDIFGNPIEANFCVDITNAINIKERMLSCHASQRDWLLEHHGVDQYLIAMREWSSQRGREFGCQYGEGFRQHLGHAYPQENSLKQILSKAVIKEK